MALHYELGGNEGSRFVHGFGSYFIYDPTFQFLTQTGFRSIAIFSTWISDRPYGL
jgi:hypothetical protein